MEYLKIILLFIFCVGIESQKCESGYKGIICDYPNNPGLKCHEFKDLKLTEDEKKIIVREHNQLRHQIATGNRTLPKGYFMKKLSWDSELAELADRWANQCGEPFNDDKQDKYLVGANIAIFAGDKIDLPRVIGEWESGLSSINESLVKNFFPQKNENMKYYSQIIWAKTEKIGCGISQYKGSCKEMVADKCPLIELVCFYSPAGNVKGNPIYSTHVNKNWICVKESSDTLCDKIIYICKLAETK